MVLMEVDDDDDEVTVADDLLDGRLLAAAEGLRLLAEDWNDNDDNG